MSDKRRRYRKPKDDKLQPQKSIVIARRHNEQQKSEADIKPKILLKAKVSEKETKEDEIVGPLPEVFQRTVIAPRSSEPNLPSTSAKEQDQTSAVQQPTQEPAQIMTRPTTILSSTGVISSNARKSLKDNIDFFVVGVIGTQGVGKSTILNLLANEDPDCNYYQKIFMDEDGTFPTKLKQNKCPSRSRTESTHMFITSDRMILLDGAPVMCNSYKKDMTTNELDDLRSITNFLTVCHLVIVVFNDYLNINFLRLLRWAELMKPSNNNNATKDFYPNVLFVQNRAKRRDFMESEIKQMNKMLESFFKGSKMRISYDHNIEQKKKGNLRTSDTELKANHLVFPEVKTQNGIPYHPSLTEIIENFRWRVFSSPRNEISPGTMDFSEMAWFDLFEKVTQNTQNFFLNTYDEIHRNHLDVNNSNHNVNGNIRDNQDNWRD